MIQMEPPGDEAIRQFVDEYRGRCLWFLNPEYYPATREEVLRVLESIQRHGDVNAFRRAGELKQWVSASSSDASASSSPLTASGAEKATSPTGRP